MLTDINRPEGSNLGGILAFKFVDVKEMNTDGYSDKIILELLGDEEYPWHEGYCIEQSMRYSEKRKESGQGVFFEKEFSGIIPKPIKLNEDLYTEMEYKKFVLAIKDSNGLVKIVGSPREPVRFYVDLESGESLANLNQHQIKFYGKGIKRSPVYTGTNLL
jgi:hypothetical protein